MTFTERLARAWRTSGSMLCVGLDPDPARMPAGVGSTPEAVYRFCTEIVDATADLVCAFKPQFAHFAAQRAEPQLERLCSYIRASYPDVPVILDAKRGDIGSTAEHYATEAFVRYGADAVTVNPYLGTDAVTPFLAHEGRAAIVLCRTSNRGGADFQSLVVDGEPLYVHVARKVATDWARSGECALVVGATYPEELRRVREIVGDLPILVPGIGAQGGDVAAAVAAGRSAAGFGMILNSSREVIYASAGADFAEAARRAAIATRDAVAHAAAATTAELGAIRSST